MHSNAELKETRQHKHHRTSRLLSPKCAVILAYVSTWCVILTEFKFLLMFTSKHVKLNCVYTNARNCYIIKNPQTDNDFIHIITSTEHVTHLKRSAHYKQHFGGRVVAVAQTRRRFSFYRLPNRLCRVHSNVDTHTQTIHNSEYLHPFRSISRLNVTLFDVPCRGVRWHGMPLPSNCAAFRCEFSIHFPLHYHFN